MDTDYTKIILDQTKIGSFIAELRKEKNLTQAQLGEILGVTNKTVSRWECGNYMPDLAIIPLLAAELGITVNELIAGQRFTEENFKRDTDKLLLQTLMLVDEVRQAKEYRQVTQWIFGVGFIIFIALASYYMLKPNTDRSLELLIYSCGLAVFGIVGLHLKRKSWLQQNAGTLLRGSLDVILIIAFWYALAHDSFVLVPGLLLGFVCMWLGSLGDNLYYKTIDTLLQKTKQENISK